MPTTGYQEFNFSVQESTNAYAVVGGASGVMDTRSYATLVLTLVVATASVDWKVQGANQPDFDDAVEVQAEAAVAGGAVGNYVDDTASFAYYRVQIKSTVADTPGSVVLAGIAK